MLLKTNEHHWHEDYIMSWKKHFTVYQGIEQQQNAAARQSGGSSSSNRFQSWLPDVYTGQPNRVDRYRQYDQMDQDSEVNGALDTIAEFCTMTNDSMGIPFQIVWKSTPSESESKILEATLKQWCNINDWDRRIFKTMRNVIKYGDQPFVRDPETWQLQFVDPGKVTKVVVNENEGKKPEQYIIADIDLNLENKTATDPIPHNTNYQRSGTQGQQSGIGAMGGGGAAGGQAKENETAVDATHVVHASLTEGMDMNWPFGTSILEPVFKVYKQKELLEDAILIYRVQRAPERRVFYIDVGNMPPHKASGFVERVKNEIHQKRIPNRTGGGATVSDAAYNPLSVLEDYFFAQTAEGRGSKVEVLPGGDNLGEVDDLKYFDDKMKKALRVPTSYMASLGGDPGAVWNDGRVGTAFIQEYRFSKYCMRLQSLVQPVFDREFKLFMRERGHQIDSALFDLKFNEPQNFSQYREIEIDGARANVFGQIEGIEYLSRRFALKKYLGLTDDEILENERMMLEEKGIGDAAGNQSGADAIGVAGTSGGGFDDLDDLGADVDDDAGDEDAGGDDLGAELDQRGDDLGGEA